MADRDVTPPNSFRPAAGTPRRFSEAAPADPADDAGDVAQLHRLATLGALAAGNAHEVNNIVTHLAASLERAVRLADRVRGGDRDGALDGLDSSLDTAILCCQRLQGIARNMTACARPTRDDRTLIAVTSVVDEAIALVEPGLPPGTHVSRDYDPGLPPIRANPGQLVQVFVNLLMNAGHAVAGIDGDRRIEVEASMGDDWVCVDVRDNGPGIPQELRDRLFEPFFTTKPDGTGTGLGLAVSLDIAHAHGGHIAVGGEVGRGATFSVVLPLRLHDEPGDGVR